MITKQENSAKGLNLGFIIVRKNLAILVSKTLYFLDYIKQKPTIVILGTWVTQENSSPVAHEKCCHSALLKTQWFIRGHKNMYWGVSICQNRTIPEKSFFRVKVIPSGKGGYSSSKSQNLIVLISLFYRMYIQLLSAQLRYWPERIYNSHYRNGLPAMFTLRGRP